MFATNQFRAFILTASLLAAPLAGAAEQLELAQVDRAPQPKISIVDQTPSEVHDQLRQQTEAAHQQAAIKQAVLTELALRLDSPGVDQES